MTTHLYCLLPRTSRDSLPNGTIGIDRAPVRELIVDELVAWVSDADSRQSPALASVREHDAVVETALATGATPIPARFGQRFADDSACAAALTKQAGALATFLETVQGCVEMTLLLTPSTKRMVSELTPALPEMIGEGPGAGRRYLEALRARETATGAIRQALDALGERLSEAVQGFVRRSAVQENLNKLPFRTISHLIERGVVAAYAEAARTVHPTAEYRVLVIGPRAPYSFSSLSSEGSMHGLRLADQS